jgi:hypothetical protein
MNKEREGRGEGGRAGGHRCRGRGFACILHRVTQNTFCFLNAASDMIKKSATRSSSASKRSSEKAASTMVSDANARNGRRHMRRRIHACVI